MADTPADDLVQEEGNGDEEAEKEEMNEDGEGEAEEDQEDIAAVKERRARQARKDRKYALLYCFFMVPMTASLRIKDMAEIGLSHNGTLSVQISKAFLYIPCILYAFWYPIKNFMNRRRGTPVELPSSIASFALRLLTSIFGVLFILYELVFILPCLTGSVTGDYCTRGTLFERILELLLFASLGIFVFFNKHYPREGRLDLFFLAHFCSTAIYVYLLTVILEETHIYHAIIHRHDPPFLAIRRGYVLSEADSCKEETERLKCIVQEYLEMIYAAICEFLVVAISIVIGIIYEVGKQRDNHEEDGQAPDVLRMKIWTCIVLLALGFQIILIVLNVQKADTDDWRIRLIFTLVHVAVITVGILTCVVFCVTGNEEHDRPLPPDAERLVEEQPRVRQRRPSERLDRYLLYFGTGGFLFYVCAGIVHSSFLIPTEYSTKYAIGSLCVNSISLVQVLLQTSTILNRDMIRNSYGFRAGIALWMVNFIMFCLDLFDAATLGIYSNPVPPDSNVIWTMFVRGLGPFDVFYRFHSLAVIAENIEHHLRHRQL